MKELTVEELEKNFDEVFEDCVENEEAYLITLPDGEKVVLAPIDENMEKLLEKDNG